MACKTLAPFTGSRSSRGWAIWVSTMRLRSSIRSRAAGGFGGRNAPAGRDVAAGSSKGADDVAAALVAFPMGSGSDPQLLSIVSMATGSSIAADATPDGRLARGIMVHL